MSDGLLGSPIWVRETDPVDADKTAYHIFRDLKQAVKFIAKREASPDEVDEIEKLEEQIEDDLSNTWVWGGVDTEWVVDQRPDVQDHTKED